MINPEKAYILGLFVGGGQISKTSFQVYLPYAKWGMNPQNMSTIATDILTKISNTFQKVYGFPVTYEIGNNKWSIHPVSSVDFSRIIDDLSELDLPCTGTLLNDADLTNVKKSLSGVVAENFLSGIFDTRASLTKSHRRFNYNAPVVSIEIPGSTKNFRFVVQLCSCTADRVKIRLLFEIAKSNPTAVINARAELMKRISFLKIMKAFGKRTTVEAYCRAYQDETVKSATEYVDW